MWATSILAGPMPANGQSMMSGMCRSDDHTFPCATHADRYRVQASTNSDVFVMFRSWSSSMSTSPSTALLTVLPEENSRGFAQYDVEPCDRSDDEHHYREHDRRVTHDRIARRPSNPFGFATDLP